MIEITEADAELAMQAIGEAISGRVMTSFPSGGASIPKGKSNREAWHRGNDGMKMEFEALRDRLGSSIERRMK